MNEINEKSDRDNKEYKSDKDDNKVNKSIEDIKSEVLRRVKPTEEEFIALENMKAEMKKQVVKNAEMLNISDVIPISVGSAERKTWLKGSHDIDIFISFPENISKEEMCRDGMLIAQKIAKDADEWEDRHAEHPYLHVKTGVFDIDIVPCFRVSDAANIKSSVDRTPFHCNYLKPRIKGLESDVLLLKQFMKGCGVYGSEVRVAGFSGYLTELLVLAYGSFENVLKEASAWKPGVLIDLENYGTDKFSDPLVVIDPTDPNRNVAAALSLDKFAEFSVCSRHFLRSPSIEYFFDKENKNEAADAENIKRKLKELIEKRKTYIFGISAKRPDVTEDTVYPQLYKMEKSLYTVLLKYEFTPVLSTVYADDETCYIIFEVFNYELPNIETLNGPPVFNEVNAEKFYQKYIDDENTYSIFIEDGRYNAQVKRRFPNIKKLINEKILTEVALGKDMKESIETGFKYLDLENILETDKIELLKNIENKILKKI